MSDIGTCWFTGALKILNSSFPHFDQFTSNFMAHFYFKFCDTESAAPESSFLELDSILTGKTWGFFLHIKKVQVNWLQMKWTIDISVQCCSIQSPVECKINIIKGKIYIQRLLFGLWHLSRLSSCHIDRINWI